MKKKKIYKISQFFFFISLKNNLFELNFNILFKFIFI
jgi:hypothetical protein